MNNHPRRRSTLLWAGLPAICATLLSVCCTPALSQDCSGEWPETFGFGRTATDDEIAAWDIDIRPDGKGLPAGSGTAKDGAPIYAAKCAVCHGKTGVEGPNDRLVKRPGEGFPAGDDADAWTSRTIGNYWPYATTVFDYIQRSMPQNMPGSLQANEVYALTAYLLWRNDIIDDDAAMDAATLAAIEMPARNQFHADDRLDHTKVH